MRLYRRFETEAEANTFAKRMEQEKRFAMKQKHVFKNTDGERVLYYEVVYFASEEDRNGRM